MPVHVSVFLRTKNKTQVLAYSRRQRENDTFSDIADALPIQENAKDLDKASILRLAINYLKLRDLIRDGNEDERDPESLGDELLGGGEASPPSDGEEGSQLSPLDPSKHVSVHW